MAAETSVPCQYLSIMGGAGMGTDSQLPQKLLRSYKAVPTFWHCTVGWDETEGGSGCSIGDHINISQRMFSLKGQVNFLLQSNSLLCSENSPFNTQVWSLSVHNAARQAILVHFTDNELRRWAGQWCADTHRACNKGHSHHFNSGWFPICTFSLKSVLGSQFTNVVIRENILIEMA